MEFVQCQKLLQNEQVRSGRYDVTSKRCRELHVSDNLHKLPTKYYINYNCALPLWSIDVPEYAIIFVIQIQVYHTNQWAHI